MLRELALPVATLVLAASSERCSWTFSGGTGARDAGAPPVLPKSGADAPPKSFRFDIVPKAGDDDATRELLGENRETLLPDGTHQSEWLDSKGVVTSVSRSKDGVTLFHEYGIRENGDPKERFQHHETAPGEFTEEWLFDRNLDGRFDHRRVRQFKDGVGVAREFERGTSGEWVLESEGRVNLRTF